MEYRRLGHSGLYVSSLTLGTMTFGGRGGFSKVGDTGVADLGVVVADASQGRGVGRALFAAAGMSAANAGATAVHLDVHPDNRRVARILRERLGARAITWDQGLLTVDAPITDAVRALVARPELVAA